MKTVKTVSPVEEGVNRRFFAAIEAIVSLGKVSSLEAFCKEFGLSGPRYRETRLTYGTTINPQSKPSRYKTIEIKALHGLASAYNVSSEWLLTGQGRMLKTIS